MHHLGHSPQDEPGFEHRNRLQICPGCIELDALAEPDHPIGEICAVLKSIDFRVCKEQIMGRNCTAVWFGRDAGQQKRISGGAAT